MPHVTRTWQAPADGEGWRDSWPLAVRRLFVRLMAAAEERRHGGGQPPTVEAWAMSRGVVAWYSARVGPEETDLRDRCRALFGAREREPT